MALVRCYTGTDGQSHFEDLDLLPSDIERSIEQTASSITFTRSPNGRFSDWHNAPRRLREGDELVGLCANGRGSPCSRAVGTLFVAVDRDRRVLRASAVRFE